ncbi:MAG: asparagine synthase (glutamine-hydrolyzing) [Proteobacteria bacterium]|nr:asparagine synthase (glutamine-hydrolyzing) [Pseudomonadota bacterium]
MCGIAGLAYSDRCRTVDQDVLQKMCTVIEHRGPDDTGLMVQGNVGIGMTRLSIIDVAGGHQPIHNEDKSVYIVFNGETYNYNELRDDLIKKGHRFYTSTDTEAIVHLYEEYGEECVKYLRGMFAFAIWDKEKQLLFIARDRLGIKPLHYYDDGERFIFGSEIKSILQAPDVPRQMQPSALVKYLPFGYIPDPETIFKGICKLPPGHSLIYRRGKTQIKQYWNVEYKQEKVQKEEFYIERLLEIMSEAVKMRLISEVPLGAFLSGGVDSSMVVALMARQMSEPVKTFSIGFENQSFNELKYARMVAEQYGTDHHEEIVNPDAESIILDLVRQFDEPFSDSSAIPTYYVSKMAKKAVTVVLSGDGGDELFGGYTHYLEGNLTRYTNLIPDFLKRTVLMNLSKVLPEWSPGINTLRSIACNENELIVRKYSRGLSTIHSEIFSKEVCEQVATTDPSETILQYIRQMKGNDNLSKLQYLDTKTYLPCDILTKVDRTSMMVSLEARVPILDHHLVEFAATIPSELKIKGMDTKYIMKKAAERLLPKEVIYRPKQGFGVPMGSWIKRDWSDMAHELVLGDRAVKRNNFNPKFLKTVMTEHRSGRRDHNYIIWTLMMLELWYREMIDKQLRV